MARTDLQGRHSLPWHRRPHVDLLFIQTLVYILTQGIANIMDRKPEDQKDLEDWKRRVKRVEASGVRRAPAFNNNRPPPDARTLQTPEKTPSTSQTRQQFLPTSSAGSEYISSFAPPAPILPESVLNYTHHRCSSDYPDGRKSALPSLRQSIHNINQQEHPELYQTPYQRSDMATMTMHAVHGQPQATWKPRERTRSQEFQTDAMTLPPIRQASSPHYNLRTTSLTPKRPFQRSTCAQSTTNHATAPIASSQPSKARAPPQPTTLHPPTADARSAIHQASTKAHQCTRSSQCIVPTRIQSTPNRSILSHSTTSAFQATDAHHHSICLSRHMPILVQE